MSDGLAIQLELKGHKTVKGDEIFLGTHGPGLRVEFNFEPGYTSPNGLEIKFGETGEPVDPPIPVTPAKPHHGISIPWGQLKALDKSFAVPWGDKRRGLSKTIAIVGATAKEKDVSKTIIKSGDFKRVDVSVSASWEDLKLHYSCTVALPWKNSIGGKDAAYSMKWNECSSLCDVQTSVPYLAPPPKDTCKKILFGDSTNFIEYRIVLPWKGKVPAKDASHRTFWGKKWYELICVKDYNTPGLDEIAFNFNEPISQTGDGLNTDFFFTHNSFDERCSQREPSGWRDQYHYIKPPILPMGMSLRTYIMISSAQLNRLPDNLAIPVKSLTLSLDWDSVHWSLAANVIGGDVRDLSPTPDGPIEVEAQINGTIWNCVVDDWARDRAFAKQGRSIRGRSQTAILGEPWAIKKTEVQSQARTAVQLMTEQLENTGWSLSSTIVDWLLPAGTLKIENETPLATIKRIATAAGGFVRPDTATKTVHVLPKYKVAPWKLTRADADMVLPGAMVVRDNGSWDGRAEADAVHIVGGISVFAKREGSAGAKPTGDVNDPLITETSVARSRAIYEIGKCGRWQKHSLSLPVFADKVPGVILPGQIIAVDDSTSWFGFVTAVSITADWGSDGLVVRQQVSVEVYCGD